MKQKNAGFTLLELVVVIGVMGLMSTMAMDLYTDKSNQKRYEATKDRLAEIKFAIIGDPMMRVGSQVITEGAFFKDMERLPRSLNELIKANTEGFCQHNNNYYVDTGKNQTQCGADPEFTWQADDSVNWNGPYLSNIQANGNTLVFRDAWGNNSNDGNFGWSFTSSDFGLALQTKGLNREAVDDVNSNQYELDYPSATNLNLINKSDLDRIMQLKNSVPSAGYCVVVSTSKIDLNFLSKSLCEDNNPVPPAIATHIWATFV